MADPEPGTRWGILGGVFDPVHRGHLSLACEMLSKADLDGVLFVPSFDPPHRSGKIRAPFRDRVEMLRLALTEQPACVVSDVEATLNQPGYTLVLITELERRYPEVEWLFIMGADNISTFSTWYRWEDILRKIKVLAGARPGQTGDAIGEFPSDRMQLVPTVTRDVSSTEVRRLIKEGSTVERLCELVPEAVAVYIREHGLYQ
jgi:nicotinate-nucleotide adenylyltransferase